ncbi:MAG: hypothetical protein ACU0DW_13700 [Shimia sp.]
MVQDDTLATSMDIDVNELRELREYLRRASGGTLDGDGATSFLKDLVEKQQEARRQIAEAGGDASKATGTEIEILRSLGLVEELNQSLPQFLESFLSAMKGRDDGVTIGRQLVSEEGTVLTALANLPRQQADAIVAAIRQQVPRLSESDVERARQTVNAQDRLRVAMETLGIEVGQRLVPAVTALTNALPRLKVPKTIKETIETEKLRLEPSGQGRQFLRENPRASIEEVRAEAQRIASEASVVTAQRIRQRAVAKAQEATARARQEADAATQETLGRIEEIRARLSEVQQQLDMARANSAALPEGSESQAASQRLEALFQDQLNRDLAALAELQGSRAADDRGAAAGERTATASEAGNGILQDIAGQLSAMNGNLGALAGSAQRAAESAARAASRGAGGTGNPAPGVGSTGAESAVTN